MAQDQDPGILGPAGAGGQGGASRTPAAPQGRRIMVTRVLKVPQRMANPQPDAELTLPWPARKDQFNGSDRVIGTHRLWTCARRIDRRSVLLIITSVCLLSTQPSSLKKCPWP
jgi:hypothetical protein